MKLLLSFLLAVPLVVSAAEPYVVEVSTFGGETTHELILTEKKVNDWVFGAEFGFRCFEERSKTCDFLYDLAEALNEAHRRRTDPQIKLDSENPIIDEPPFVKTGPDEYKIID